MEKAEKTQLWGVDSLHNVWVGEAAEGGAWKWEEEMGAEELIL